MKTRFQTNERFGEYRVVEFIGRGGMGEVYRFVHEGLGRSVAVKVLSENVLANDSYKERFMNEARLQASLQHPNVAQLYDFQQAGDELLIFMEFVDGEGLDGLIEKGHYSTGESLEIFGSIVETIRFVHANGIIHRDIKADNVKINSAGIPKLLDFGIAKDSSSRSLTQVGGVIGTPNYLAPEQIEGGEASPQTDVWALGVLLYKMLTRRLPFDGERMENVVSQILVGKFEVPETFNLAIPRSVSNIVLKCLAKDPSKRYQTADELLVDVRRVIAERYSNETAGPIKPRRRFSAGTAFGVAASIVVLIGLIATVIWAATSRREIGSEKAGASNTAPGVPEKQSVPGRQSEVATQRPPGEKGGRSVRVDTIGGSAEVWKGEKKLGNTPLDLEIGDQETVNLRLRRPGYEDTEEFVSASKRTWTFTLKRK